MSRKIICDRCGSTCATFGPKKYTILDFRQRKTKHYAEVEYETDDGRTFAYHLCADCIKEFTAWIHGKRAECDAG